MLTRIISRHALIMPILLMCSACAPSPIKPWERQWLAQPGMEPGNVDMSQTLDDHFYYSKEGTSGGRGFAGGGCGCN